MIQEMQVSMNKRKLNEEKKNRNKVPSHDRQRFTKCVPTLLCLKRFKIIISQLELRFDFFD
jgi:hypothetical protein